MACSNADAAAFLDSLFPGTQQAVLIDVFSPGGIGAVQKPLSLGIPGRTNDPIDMSATFFLDIGVTDTISTALTDAIDHDNFTDRYFEKEL